MRRLGLAFLALGLLCARNSLCHEVAGVPRLDGFDSHVRSILRDFKCPGMGIGIVVGDRLIFAKGYGYRDLRRGLPFTPDTLFAIGSNTKLFTAIAAGLLVSEGKLTYDEPIRRSVPAIRFFDDTLTDEITLRDMLSHRTGISRHDSIWFNSNYNSQELFDKLQYLDPAAPFRTRFIYNNLMYAAVGRVIELQSGLSYQGFIRQTLLNPLKMNATRFSVVDMRGNPDHAVPMSMDPNSRQLHDIPYFHEFAGLAAAGAIVSNVNDLSHWLIALMNEGQFDGQQVVPTSVLASTMEPSISVADWQPEDPFHAARLNPYYGMGRFYAVFRGHEMTYHGGHIDGYRSQIAFLPRERIGVIVLAGGDHTENLYDAISFNVFERLLGLDLSAWAGDLRRAQIRKHELKKSTATEADQARVMGTHPSHALGDYVGTYRNKAYGILDIRLEQGALQFNFHDTQVILAHFHYDRFDTPEDPIDGTTAVNFSTGASGLIEAAALSLDGSEIVFRSDQRATAQGTAP